MGGQFHGEVASEGGDCTFGGGIDGVIGDAGVGMNGGKIDHRTAACFLHIGQRALGAENVTAHIDGEQFIEVVGRDIGDRARLGQAGVVDEHVEATEVVGGGFYDVCAYCGGFRKVSLHGCGRSSGGLDLGNGSGCAFVAVGVVADDGCAAAGQF